MSMVMSFDVASDAPRAQRLRTRRIRRSPDGWLIGIGIALAVGTLLFFALLRCLGLLTPDTMTLLPAAASAGTAAVSLGVVLACLRELRGA